MNGRLHPIVFVVGALLAACNDQTGGYVAAAAISRNGLARNADELRARNGQAIKVWGFVDHANLYGDDAAKAILGEWWSGDGPSATTWRFNLKANENDRPGHSFPVRVHNDQGREELLRAFAEDARAQRPTKVFVNGTVFTFDAPANATTHTGLYVEVRTSRGVLLGHSQEN